VAPRPAVPPASPRPSAPSALDGRRPLRILLSAYACEPGKGSEPGVGWYAARSLASRHDVWVLTRANNRPAIERALAGAAAGGPHFAYYDLPKWAGWWKRGTRGMQAYYYLWQLGAWRIGRQLHRRIGFDLVHHVTFAKYWTPSFLALLPLPFVWGPVGGGERVPGSLRGTFGVLGAVFELARDLAQWVGARDPFVRMTARRCAVALAATQDTARRLARLGVREVRVLSQLGLADEELSGSPSIFPPTDHLRFVSVGSLLRWKGIHLALAAFAAAGLPDAEFWIIGEGPERRRLEALAGRLRIAGRVRFWGRLPRAGALHKLAESHVLVFPALRDSGGMVWLEAMAAGRPVICLDVGGPAQVPADAGFKVPARGARETVWGLAEAMRRFGSEPDLWRRMGAAARRCSFAYRWEDKAARFDEVFRTVLTESRGNGAWAHPPLDNVPHGPKPVTQR
jgi:glycosyltransferase involved in cell wall biosynthesis